MNVLFNDVMTVYNYRQNKNTEKNTEKDTWKRTVVKGVQWRHNRKELSTSNNEQNLTRAESITVDFSRDYGNMAQYVPPHEFKRMPDEEISGYWTLDAKEGQDVLVLGISEYEIGRDCRLLELSDLFQYTATVTAVSDNRNMPRLKNIKVVAE